MSLYQKGPQTPKQINDKRLRLSCIIVQFQTIKDENIWEGGRKRKQIEDKGMCIGMAVSA